MLRRRDILLLVSISSASLFISSVASSSLPVMGVATNLAKKTQATNSPTPNSMNKSKLEQNETKVLTINPKSFTELVTKGANLIKLKQYNESIPYFDKALALHPNSFYALFNKGVALFALKQYNESIPYFDKALGINSSKIIALNYKKLSIAALHKK